MNKLIGLFVFAVTVGSVANAGINDISMYKLGGLNQIKVADQVIHATDSQVSYTKWLNSGDTKAIAWGENHNGKVEQYYSINVNGVWTTPKLTVKTVQIRGVTFDPVDLAKSPIASSTENRLFIVQLQTQSLSAYKEQITNVGAKIVNYLPDNVYIAEMNTRDAQKVSSLGFIRAVALYPSSLKMSAKLLSAVKNDSLVTQRYHVSLTSEAVKTEVLDQIRQMGGQIHSSNGESTIIDVVLSPAQVIQVSSLSHALWIEPVGKIEMDDMRSRTQGGINYLQELKTPYGFTGVGIHGHVMEGIYATHPDLAAKATRMAPISVMDNTPDEHGTNTFGIIFGDGKNRRDAIGALPDAQGFYTNYNAVYEQEGSRQALVKKLMDENQVMFQTASWGYERTLEYTAKSLEMDELIFNLDIPITQSQSNAGDQMSRPQAWAKNIISVGGVYHNGTVNPLDDKWNFGASIGPATDGRIKPDLCAYYDQIVTIEGESGYTNDFGGTSGATPIVAGYVGLSIEMWAKGIFGNKLSAPVEQIFKNRPHFTTTKALLINTAEQYAFQGESHDLTRVHQGWGFPSVRNMYDWRENTFVVNEEKVLKNLESAAYTLTVAPGQKQLKATMVYADPPGVVGAAVHRVNDLDLKVVAPDGTIYWGNYGLLANNYSVAGGKKDSINTVENVFVKDPAPGQWKVTVLAAEINKDGYLSDAAEDSAFALVVSGVTK